MPLYSAPRLISVPRHGAFWRQLLDASQPCLLRVAAVYSAKCSALLLPLALHPTPSSFLLCGRGRALALADPVGPGMRWYSPTALAWQMVSKSYFFLFSRQPFPGAETPRSAPFCSHAWRRHNTVQSQGSFGGSGNWSSQSGVRVGLAIGHCHALHRPDV